MLKVFFLSVFLCSSIVFAQEDCPENFPGLNEVEQQTKELIKTVNPQVVKNFIVQDKNRDHWILTFRFGPTLNYYPRTDYHFKNANMDVTLKDVKFQQRLSMSYYKVWELKEHNPFQWIDEPTNQMVLQLEQPGKFAVGLRAVHSKTVIRSSYEVNELGLSNPNSAVHVNGTLRGQNIDSTINIHDLFDNIEISRLFYNVEIYAQKLIPIVSSKNTQLNFKLGGAVGIYVGTSRTVPTGDLNGDTSGEWTTPMQFMGKNASFKTGLDFNYKKIVISADYNLVAGQIKYEAGGGQAEIPFLMTQNVSLGLGVKLFDSKKKK